METRLEIIEFTKEVIIPKLDLPTEQVMIIGSTTDDSRWKVGDVVDLRVVNDNLPYCEHLVESHEGVRFKVYSSNFPYDRGQISSSIEDYYPRIPRIYNEGIILKEKNTQLQLSKLKSLAKSLIEFPPLLTQEEIDKTKKEVKGDLNTALNKLRRYSPSQSDQFIPYIQLILKHLYRYENTWRPRNRNLVEDLGKYSPELRNYWVDLTADRKKALTNRQKLDKLISCYEILVGITGRSEPPMSVMIPSNPTIPSQPL
jgi:hypothetical protein